MNAFTKLESYDVSSLPLGEHPKTQNQLTSTEKSGEDGLIFKVQICSYCFFIWFLIAPIKFHTRAYSSSWQIRKIPVDLLILLHS